MLSRTAANLYWTARYVERADFVARLVEATLRLARLGSVYGADPNDAWFSALASSNVSGAFYGRHGGLSEEAAVHFLTLDRANPSSVGCCIDRARANARTVRTAFSLEAWETLNDAWHAIDEFGLDSLPVDRVSDLIETTRHAVMAYDGAVQWTMLRSEAYWFLQLGAAVERADGTSRLLDQKYHLLLPRDQPVGGGLDYFQWSAILRTISGVPAYHVIYRDSVKPWLVADLLIFNDQVPRSLSSCYRDILVCLRHLSPASGRRRSARRIATTIMERLKAADIEKIFGEGLHEFLREFIAENNNLGTAISEQFMFPGAVAVAAPLPVEQEAASP
jgi:uncharacterized alpha-E superfamily protein